MNENGYNNNPFEEDSEDYLFKMVTNNGKRKTYGWSLASVVSGTLSLICCCTGYAALILGVLAVVFAIISRKNLGYFDSMAISGLVLGIIGFVIGLSLLIYVGTMDEETKKNLIEEFYKQYGIEADDSSTPDF